MSDEEIEATILRLCQARKAGSTICPSEVARALALEEMTWRAAMPDVRRVAARLAGAGRIIVTQRGKIVDPITARGPIRLALIRKRMK